jgi:hypothetical protein
VARIVSSSISSLMGQEGWDEDITLASFAIRHLRGVFLVELS